MKNTVKIMTIYIDGANHMGGAIAQWLVDIYKEAIYREDIFPPLKVFEIDGKNYLIDEFHRYMAYLSLGYREFDVVKANENFPDAKTAAEALNPQKFKFRLPETDRLYLLKKAEENFETQLLANNSNDAMNKVRYWDKSKLYPYEFDDLK